MRLFTIIESFGPPDGEKWTSYIDWRGCSFERFESIDGILRPNLFETPNDDDWKYVVNENFMVHFITDFGHAQRKHQEIGRGDLVGVSFDEHDIGDGGFLGFDIIDGYCDVSLLTNWGNDVTIINRSLGSNALVSNADCIREIFDELKSDWGDDPHVEGCRVVSIYDPTANKTR